MSFKPSDLPNHLRERLGCAIPTKPARKPRGTGRVGTAKREACAAANRIAIATHGEGFIALRIDDLKVVSEANNTDNHWKKTARKNKQKLYVRGALLENRAHLPPLPVSVIFRRFGPKLLDTDNLTGAFKACRDEVARFYGVDDAPGGPITWQPPEQAEHQPYAIVIMIDSVAATGSQV